MMPRGSILVLRVGVLAIALALTLGACGGAGGDGQEIRGLVTGVDAGAQTFTIQGDDGRSYIFKMVDGSRGDLPEIKEHMDLKKPVEVRYRGTAPPYEVISAH